MIRIIIRTDDAQMAANVGGSVHETFRTFDVNLPEVEAYLREKKLYVERRAIGIELLPADGDGGTEGGLSKDDRADLLAIADYLHCDGVMTTSEAERRAALLRRIAERKSP